MQEMVHFFARRVIAVSRFVSCPHFLPMQINSRMFTTLTRTQARLRQAHERAQHETKERLRNEAAAAVMKKSRSVLIDLPATVMDENRNSVAAGSDDARTG